MTPSTRGPVAVPACTGSAGAGLVTWLTQYAGHVDGHHRAQLLAAADEIADLRAQVRALEPVGWQWLTTSNFRRKLPKDAERGAWRRIYVRSREGGQAVSNVPPAGDSV